jgi:hypothetical protein
MDRRRFSTVLLLALSLACQVRPRFMEDCPEVADAKVGLRAPAALTI